MCIRRRGRIWPEPQQIRGDGSFWKGHFMKVARFAVCMVGLGFFISMLGGCQTDSPGVKNVAGTYTAMVDGSPDRVAKAAKNAVEDLKLMYIASTATKGDGKVT